MKECNIRIKKDRPEDQKKHDLPRQPHLLLDCSTSIFLKDDYYYLKWTIRKV